MTDHALDLLAASLDATTLKVRRDGDHFDLKGGSGLQGRSAAFTGAMLRETLGDVPFDRVSAAAVARALEGVLTEPARSRGPELSFEEAAASMGLTLEAPGFEAGCVLAGGQKPWTYPFGDGLCVTCRIELDNGFRVLPAAQAERWGVHPERIYRAALSLLFHRTRAGAAEDVEGAPGVTAWRLGDGFDAARVLVLDALDWARASSGLHVSCPEAELLLVADSADAAAVSALERVTRERFEAAVHPLRPSVYRVERAKLRVGG